MKLRYSIRLLAPVVLGLATAMSGCIVSPTHDAPIVERSQTAAPQPVAAPSAAPPEQPAVPLAREAHSGLYVVQAGDTLYSIALAFGQDFRDIARWNGVDDPTHIRVGQTLRVLPATADDSGGGVAEATPVPVSPSGAVETRPLVPSDSIAPQPAPAPTALDRSAEASRSAAPPPAVTSAERASPVEPQGVWVWPSAGKLLERFEETHNKGIDIGGSVGDPVWAANDGQVVYSGSGLHGYGKLVIIKHTDDYVSAYAHNNEILVTQGQAVKRGQQIAELGMTDAPIPTLHFEIRRRGKPVDPLTYLPSR
jgi:lipoprotein NlpD